MEKLINRTATNVERTIVDTQSLKDRDDRGEEGRAEIDLRSRGQWHWCFSIEDE